MEWGDIDNPSGSILGAILFAVIFISIVLITALFII
jgi:hypothetical protein